MGNNIRKNWSFWISNMIFLAALTIFIYEWKKGAGVGMRIIDTDEKLKKVPDEFKQIAKDFAEKDS